MASPRLGHAKTGNDRVPLDKSEAKGRPVGVLVDRKNGLLVADNVGNAIWRLTGPTG